ncbi:hypothetical protein JDV02_008803 [Purpureocillium takamizusanense]|uniref:Uncharacterized protein n=1 Tax=Purpureocillium takamizusanense TaxID=2060973 RepID=A0A9Q8QNH5_9HYPO|nr:uncharacterized protein JDV02_008803 [Purpureocillium takamizusanense]UNI22960.1 hypothetical protein JDV02_008803 [Purpureocillium takamizusanense]
MRALSLLLGLAALGSAFVIPENMTDGVYEVIVDHAGNELHRRIGDADVVGPIRIRDTNRRKLESRAWKDKLKTNCNCWHDLKHSDTDGAVDALVYQIGPMRQFKGPSVFSIKGDVVAFACNPGTKKTYTSNWLIPRLLDEVTEKCGTYVSGAARQDNGGDYPVAYVGYMESLPGYSLCPTVMNYFKDDHC